MQWIYFYFIFFLTMISLIYCKIRCLYLPILYLVWFNSSKIFWAALVIAISFLSFKGMTHAYLLQMSMTHNENLKPLLNLLINCISAKSLTQILSIKDTFLLLKFLIIGLCNSSANSLLEIFSLVISLLKVFLSKNYKTSKQVHIDIHHIFDH